MRPGSLSRWILEDPGGSRGGGSSPPHEQTRQVLQYIFVAALTWWKEVRTIYDRKRQSEWDRRGLRTVSTHLTTDEALRLQELCRERGITLYHVLRRYCLRLLEDFDGAAALGSAPAITGQEGGNFGSSEARRYHSTSFFDIWKV